MDYSPAKPRSGSVGEFAWEPLVYIEPFTVRFEDGMIETGEDDLTRAQSELGTPDVLFQINRARIVTKLSVGLSLLIFGLIGNYLLWSNGPAALGLLWAKFLIVVPLSGAAILYHMYRNRGLFVLIYPTGLLRLRRGEVDSFPWSDVESIRLKIKRAERPEFDRDGNGLPIACWLPVEVPSFQLWTAGLTIARTDGVEAQFGPALSDYDRLAEEIQKRTFAALWPPVWGGFRAGEPVEFDDLIFSPAGIRHQKKLLPWKDLKEVTIAQGKLTVKQAGKWLPWAMVDVKAIPNPHVLFALIAEARRLALGASHTQPQAADADHAK